MWLRWHHKHVNLLHVNKLAFVVITTMQSYQICKDKEFVVNTWPWKLLLYHCFDSIDFFFTLNRCMRWDSVLFRFPKPAQRRKDARTLGYVVSDELRHCSCDSYDSRMRQTTCLPIFCRFFVSRRQSWLKHLVSRVTMWREIFFLLRKLNWLNVFHVVTNDPSYNERKVFVIWNPWKCHQDG